MTISLSPTLANLTRTGLFGKDFDSIVAEIQDNLVLRFGQDISAAFRPGTMLSVLIEMTAVALASAHWYGDRQTDDRSLSTALLYSRLVQAARQLGYKAASAVPASVDLEITLQSPPPVRVVLGRGRKLVGPGGLTFELTEDVVFDAGDVGPKTGAASQGQTLESIHTSNGEPGQVFHLTGVPEGEEIAHGSVRCFVDGVEWTEQDFLSPEQTDHFEVSYTTRPAFVIFGNGAAGNIPPVNAEVRISYFTTLGPAGAVPANSVTSFAEPVVAGTTTIGVTITHSEPSTPGSARESSDSIRVNAPLVFQSQRRAVTQKDLDGLIKAFVDPTFGQVAIARATVPTTVDEDAEALTVLDALANAGAPQDVVDGFRAYMNKILSSDCAANSIVVQILAADTEGRYVQAPRGLAEALSAYLDTVTYATAKTFVVDGSINLISVDLAINVKILPSFANPARRELILEEVRSAVEGLLLGRPYGAALRRGDLYAAAEGVEGVDYTQITVTGDSKALARLTAAGDIEIGDHEVITLGKTPAVTEIL